MATSSVKIASKNHIWQIARLLIIFFRKKQRKIECKKRSKGHGLATCMRINIDAMTGVELRAQG